MRLNSADENGPFLRVCRTMIQLAWKEVDASRTHRRGTEAAAAPALNTTQPIICL
jgi:hypothetical protein